MAESCGWNRSRRHMDPAPAGNAGYVSVWTGIPDCQLGSGPVGSAGIYERKYPVYYCDVRLWSGSGISDPGNRKNDKESQTIMKTRPGKFSRAGFLMEFYKKFLKTGISWKDLHIFLFSVQNMNDSLYIFRFSGQDPNRSRAVRERNADS